MVKVALWLSVALLVTVPATVAPLARQSADRDAFAVVRAIAGTKARARCGRASTRRSGRSRSSMAGRRSSLRHPAPPPDFTHGPGQPGVVTMAGRHPAVVANSTREIAGVRTATVIAPPTQPLDNILLAYVEEVFHVFWLRRHANFRPNEMVRYGYPVSDAWNRERLLAEDEALARALDAVALPEAAAWGRAALRIRRERLGERSADEQAFEKALEMMEGTANYVARAAVGQPPSATAVRLRSSRQADAIRWRFYDSGAALCFLLERFQPDWKSRLDAQPDMTVADLLDTAITRTGEQLAAFSAAESSGFERRAATDIAELAARQRQVRDDLLGRAGPRIVIEIADGDEPLRMTRFDPINLLVLGAREVAHANYLTFTRARQHDRADEPGVCARILRRHGRTRARDGPSPDGRRADGLHRRGTRDADD